MQSLVLSQEQAVWGDKNMNDATYEGLKKLEEKGAEINVVEPDDASDFPNLQSLFAERGEFDAVFCISFEQTDSLAKQHRNIRNNVSYWLIQKLMRIM